VRHFIPIVNRVAELLPAAIAGCEPLWHCTTIIDNRDTEAELALNLAAIAPGITICRPPVPLTTAQSMNLMLAKANQMGLSFFTWQHLDAVCLEDSADQLPAIARAAFDRGIPWGCIFTHYDAFAAYNVGALNAVGGWDWQRFPYYFLDDDLNTRLMAAGYRLIDTGLPVSHLGSTTISDPDRAKVNHAMFKASESLYREKHGRGPGFDKTRPDWWKDLCCS
jgi:hypothetical protein